jgi:hypothetical protein
MATILTNQEFEESPSAALKAAANGAVFIVDRGRTSYVLLTFEDYARMNGGHMSLADALRSPALTLILTHRKRAAGCSARTISTETSGRSRARSALAADE